VRNVVLQSKSGGNRTSKTIGLSHAAHRELRMLQQSSDVMEWAVTRWRLSTSRWCWPNYSTHPPPAWLGFTNSADEDRIEAFVWRGVKLCLYQDTDPTASQLVKILTTNYSEQFCTILNMSSITCCQTELIIHIHADVTDTTALSVRRLTLETF